MREKRSSDPRKRRTPAGNVGHHAYEQTQSRALRLFDILEAALDGGSPGTAMNPGREPLEPFEPRPLVVHVGHAAKKREQLFDAARAGRLRRETLTESQRVLGHGL